MVAPFVRKSLELSTAKVAMLLRLACLEGNERRTIYEQSPLARVWVFSRRLQFRRPGWEDTGEDGSDTSPIDFEMASLMKDAPVRLRIVEDAEEPSHASLSFLELPGRDHSDDFSQYLHRSCHDGSAAEDLSGSETDENDIEHWLTITTYIHFILPFSDEDTGDDESEEDSEEGETALQCWIGGVTEVGDGGDINDTRHKVMEALMQALDYRSLR
jgi:hypothetical protein